MRRCAWSIVVLVCMLQGCSKPVSYLDVIGIYVDNKNSMGVLVLQEDGVYVWKSSLDIGISEEVTNRWDYDVVNGKTIVTLYLPSVMGAEGVPSLRPLMVERSSGNVRLIMSYDERHFWLKEPH